jgi:hypothetical protein
MGVDPTAVSRLHQRQEAVLARCLALEARRVLPDWERGDWGAAQQELCPTHARLRAELLQRCACAVRLPGRSPP